MRLPWLDRLSPQAINRLAWMALCISILFWCLVLVAAALTVWLLATSIWLD